MPCCADITPQFTAYLEEIKQQKREAMRNIAVFPSIVKILPDCIFNKKDPIVLGVEVTEGILKIGTPLCIPDKDDFLVGRVTDIQDNHKSIDLLKKGNSAAVSIMASDSSTMYGRQFDHNNTLVSRLDRNSINALKEHFRHDLGKEDWRLVMKLKKVFGVI